MSRSGQRQRTLRQAGGSITTSHGLKQASGSDTLGLAVIAAPLVVSAVILVALGRDRRLEHIPSTRRAQA